MNNILRFLLIAFAATTVGLSIYVVSLRRELANARRASDAITVERDLARKDLDLARSQAAPLLENVTRLTAERDRLRKASPGETAPSSAVVVPSKSDNPFGAFAQSFAAPEMKQMIRRDALMDAKKGFADLLKKWKLSPTDGEQFLEFVADRDSADSTDAMEMLASGKLDEKAIAEQEERQAKAKEESNARLKALLGEARFAEFEAFDARKAELASVSSYRDHLEAAGSPLNDEQRSALAKIVKAEKPDENDWSSEDIDFLTKGMTDEHLAKLRQKQEGIHARIAQQAAAFLSPDQVNALQAAFRAEAEEQDLGLKVVRNLFQANGTGTTAP